MYILVNELQYIKGEQDPLDVAHADQRHELAHFSLNDAIQTSSQKRCVPLLLQQACPDVLPKRWENLGSTNAVSYVNDVRLRFLYRDSTYECLSFASS